MNRRRFLESASAALMIASAFSRGAGATAARESAQVAGAVPKLAGTPYPLVALPTKQPMGQVYDIPPNYETPTPHLIGTKNYPMTDNEYYYVRYREAMPAQLDPATFRLKISGDAVEHPAEFSLADLRALPQVKLGAVGECTGLGRGLLRPMVPGLPWTKGDVSCAEWTGASLAILLKQVGVKPDAKMVTFKSGANTISKKKPAYIRAYQPESVLTPDAMLAFGMNGEDLNFWNGYPLRLVVPGTYAPSWVKQLVEIEIRTTEDPGEWSGRPIGKGLLKTYSLITEPIDGTQVPAGSIADLRGVAWDHGQGIEKVEISADEGKTWEEATLEPSVGRYVWRVFTHSVTIAKPGQTRILSRATSADGTTQPMDVAPEIIQNGGRQNNAIDTFAAILIGS